MNAYLLAAGVLVLGVALTGCSTVADLNKADTGTLSVSDKAHSGVVFSTRRFTEGDRSCDVLVGRNKLPVTRLNKGTGKIIGYAVGRCPKSEPVLANINLYNARSFEFDTFVATVYREDKKRNKIEKIYVREKNGFGVYSFVTTKKPL